MAIKKEGQERVVANQMLMLSALSKIEEYSKVQSEKLTQIDLNISTQIVSGVAIIVTELKRQSNILNGILKKLGGQKIKDESAGKKVALGNSMEKILASDSSKNDIIGIAKIIALLGVGFIALAKGVSMMKNIDAKQALVFGVVLISLFASIAFIVNKGYNIRLRDAVGIAATMIILSMAVESVSRIFAKIEDVSNRQLLIATLVTTTVGGIAIYLVRDLADIFKDRGIISSLAITPIIGLAGMGTLLLLPMLALATTAAANIFNMMPDGISSGKLSAAFYSSLAIIPMAFVYKEIFFALRGRAINMAIRTGSAIAGKMSGATGQNPMNIASAMGSALLVIPLLAAAITLTAWIFKLLPTTMVAPPREWIISAGIGLTLFAMAFFRLRGSLDAFSKAGGGGPSGGTSLATAADIAKMKDGKSVMSFKGFGQVGMVLLMALSIVATAWIFKLLPETYKAPPIDWILKMGFAMILFSSAIGRIIGAFKGKPSLIKVALKGATMQDNKPDPITPGQLYSAVGAMAALAGGLVLIAWATKLLPDTYKAPPLGWILAIGLALFILAKVAAIIVKVVRGDPSRFMLGDIEAKGSGRKLDKRDMFLAATAQLIIAGTMVAIAFITLALPSADILQSPPIWWTIEMGLSLFIFAKVMSMLVSVFMGVDKTPLPTSNLPVPKDLKLDKPKRKLNMTDILMGGAMMVVLAVSIIAVAYVMAAFPSPDSLNAPPIMWTLRVGLALVLFAFSASLLLGVLGGKGGKASSMPGIPTGANKLLGGKVGGKIGTKELIQAGIMISILAASMVVVALILKLFPTDPKAPPLGWTIKVGIAMVLFGYSAKLIMDKIPKSQWSDLLKAGVMVLILAAAIVATAYIFQALPADDAMKAPPLLWILKTGLAMTLFAGAMYLVMLGLSSSKKRGPGLVLFGAAGTTDKAKPLDDIGKIAKAGLVMMVIAGSIVATAWIFQLLPGSYKEAPPIEWVLQAGFAIIVMGAAFALIGLVHKKVEQGGRAFAMSAIGILAIIYAMKIWTEITITPLDVLTFVGFVAVIAGAMWLAGKFAPQIEIGAFAMISASVPILILSFSMVMWKKAGVELVDVAIMSGFLVAIGLAMAGAGFLSPFILAGAGAMIVAGVALMTISSSVSSFAKTYDSYPEFFDNGGIKLVIDSIAHSFNLSFGDIFRIARSTPALIGAGLALGSIGKGLNEYIKATKDVDVDDLSYNIETVITTVGDVFGKIGNKYGGANSIKAVLKGLLFKDPISRGIAMTRGMGKVLTNIAKGTAAWVSLDNMRDEHHKKIKWDPDKISYNIRTVVDLIADVFGNIGARGKPASTGKFAFLKNMLKSAAMSIFPTERSTAKDIESGIDAVGGMGRVLTRLAEGTAAWIEIDYLYDSNGKKMKFDSEAISKNIKKIVTVVADVFGQIGQHVQPTWFESNILGKKKIDIPEGEYSTKQVSKGISSLMGISDIMVGISQSVATFMNLEKGIMWTDEKGVKHHIPFDADKIKTNIQLIIGSLVGALGQADDVGYIGPDGKKYNTNDAEDAIKELKNINDATVPIIKFVTAFSKLENYEKSIERIKSIFKVVTISVMDAWSIINKNEKGFYKTVEIFNTLPMNMASAVEKMAKHESAIKKLATHFGSIAKSMVDVKDSVNAIDSEKFTHVNSMLWNVKELARVGQDQGDEIKDNISEGMKDGMEQMVEIWKNNITAQPTQTVAASTPSAPTTIKVNNDNVVEVMNALLAEMQQIKQKLNEVPVRVMNEDFEIN